MTANKACENCGKQFTLKYGFEKTCYDCFKKRRTSTSESQAATPPKLVPSRGSANKKVFDFGKHIGKTFEEVYATDKGYVRWVLEQKDFGRSKLQSLLREYVEKQDANIPGSAASSQVAAGSSRCSARSRSRTPPRERSPEGDRNLSIGKHSGKAFRTVFDTEKGYVQWVQSLDSPSGQLRIFRDYVLKKLAQAGKSQRTSTPGSCASAQQLKKRDPVAEARRQARADFWAFLELKFEEYRRGYPNLTELLQLRTGHDPFGELIKKEGDEWMETPNHKNYKKHDHWDPRKILEWGVTYYDKYSDDAKVKAEAILRQKAAIEIMLQQSCLLVKPNVKIQIYWLLQEKYKTYSRDIERVFGGIFQYFQEVSAGREAQTDPPINIDGRSAEDIFDASFCWNWEWPLQTRVQLACKYYMANRSEYEHKKESAEASDRRILMIQMLLRFVKDGDLVQVQNSTGREILYQAPQSKVAILVEAPDEGAVHVFQRPDDVADDEHHNRIFAFFRHFYRLITQQITFQDGSKAFARVGDDEQLPEAFVMDAVKKADATQKKLEKSKKLLEAHPEMTDALSVQPKSNRPSLKDFVGWKKIITHRKQALTKDVCAELGVAEERAQFVEKEAIEGIKQAREEAGDTTDFHGGSWQ
mmetsp:Transcript_17390/g.40608  ORF Transcript_17390/g.40608 Transcript_17390/m.40608 type:complete len:642 (+) Transcript_17390:56-1981(+)